MAKSQHTDAYSVAEDALEIAKLAGLSKLDYDRERDAAAERLGCRVTVLDELVDKARGESGGDHKGLGRPLVFEEPVPWSMEVDGAQLLDEIVEVLERFLILPDGAADAIALWILHTYVFQAAMITPRLLLKSAQKRSGKTTLLTIIDAICARPLSTANVTAAAVFRCVELAQPTLLIDEGDTFIARDEELRGGLNAGFQKGGQAVRLVGDHHEPRMFSCWAPVAIAAIRRLPDTIEDRSVAIMLKRRRRDEDVEKMRSDRLSELAPLASKARRWADDNFDLLVNSDPHVPNQLNDRAADCWRILLGIAERAGGLWPERARNASLTLSAENTDIETAATRLLWDLRQLFKERATNRLLSEDIVEALVAMEHRSWAEWGKHSEPMSKVQLARLLSHFGIRPKDVRCKWPDGKDRVAKGYELSEQLKDVFDRYLAPELSGRSEP